MRNLKQILVVFTIFSFIVSCSKDESNIPEKDEQQEQPENPDPDENPDNEVDKTGNRLTMGVSGSELLTAENFKSIHLELAFVESYEPEEEAIELLKEFINERSYKPNGIKVTKRSLPSSNKAPFDRNDWESIEDENRQIYNDGDELAVWIYFADGGRDSGNGETTNSLGTAYKNTSIIIYEEQILDYINGAPIYKEIAEAVILRHEFGHLFGLVDNGITPITDHADGDPDSHHCTTEGCLMSTNKTYSYYQEEPFKLGGACIQDLQSIGGK